MGALSPGYLPPEYFPADYWHDGYWQDYAAFTQPSVPEWRTYEIPFENRSFVVGTCEGDIMRFCKDPDAVKDYSQRWALWLNGDTIVSSEWLPDDGITVDSSSHDDDTTYVWLSGGTVGEVYTVTNRITTAAGRTEDRSLEFYIKET